MALLRECLQELRTKRHEWDVPASGWPQSRLQQQPLPRLSLLAHAERNHGRREIASQRRPAA